MRKVFTDSLHKSGRLCVLCKSTHRLLLRRWSCTKSGVCARSLIRYADLYLSLFLQHSDMTIAPPQSLGIASFDFITTTPEQIEQDAIALTDSLRSLGAHHLLALKVSAALGGKDLSRRDFFTYQVALARYSGTLAFTQTQHQSAASFITNSENSVLQEQYLPSMATGEILIGVGFSHLRQQGTPRLVATPSDRGYQLTGTIPWLTGWGIFQKAVIAATLPDGQSVWGLLPLHEESSVHCSSPMALAGMPATQTVSIQLDHYCLDRDHVLGSKPANWIATKDQMGVLNAAALSLGSAQAALDIVERASRQHSELLRSYELLRTQLGQCQRHIHHELEQTQLDFERSVELRAAAIAIAGRCAQAAITVSRGGANQLTHPAQRIYREMLVFTVSGQTPAVLSATLQQIAQG